jgi:archaellum component FlaC
MTISIDLLLQICAGFTCVCVSGGWLIRIFKGIKKPADDVHEKLDNDNKRIKSLEGELDYISKSISVLMRSNLVILGHLSTNNNTQEMAKMEKEIQDFLINN